MVALFAFAVAVFAFVVAVFAFVVAVLAAVVAVSALAAACFAILAFVVAACDAWSTVFSTDASDKNSLSLVNPSSLYTELTILV